MDNQRLLTWGLFIMLAWFTYQTWQIEYNSPPPPAEEVADLDTLPTDTLPAVSDTVTQDSLPTAGDAPVPTVAPVQGPEEQTVKVRTDVYELEFSTRGGALVSATMLGYPVSKKTPDQLVKLLSPTDALFARFQLGLRGGDIAGHDALMQASANSYDLGNSDELRVPFTWRGESGINVTRTYIFKRGSYRIDVEQRVENGSGQAWSGDQYVQLVRRSGTQERSMFNPDSYSFDGAIVYDGDSSDKISHKDLGKENVSYSAANGWLGSIQHHFLNAIVPVRDQQHAFQVTLQNGNRMIASVVSPRKEIAPGQADTFTTILFTGPKLQNQLEEIDPRLKLTVDYGILTILSQPMFWMMSLAHDYTNNWGWAIILVTIFIKLVFYKLTETSGRSMAKMRELQPRMKALQDRYKDDRQALSQAMMDLYKREKVNPAAGCLPLLVQMPFFLAFYWVLVESVEMRQAEFALWLTDLSTMDPYFILPAIMGGAMFLQQKLNPAPTDPVQARVMQIMPFIFTAMFAFFPSGLVLYWVTNTVLSIAQQWKINRVVAAEAKEQKDRRNKKNTPESS